MMELTTPQHAHVRNTITDSLIHPLRCTRVMQILCLFWSMTNIGSDNWLDNPDLTIIIKAMLCLYYRVGHVISHQMESGEAGRGYRVSVISFYRFAP